MTSPSNREVLQEACIVAKGQFEKPLSIQYGIAEIWGFVAASINVLVNDQKVQIDGLTFILTANRSDQRLGEAPQFYNENGLIERRLQEESVVEDAVAALRSKLFTAVIANHDLQKLLTRRAKGSLKSQGITVDPQSLGVLSMKGKGTGNESGVLTATFIANAPLNLPSDLQENMPPMLQVPMTTGYGCQIPIAELEKNIKDCLNDWMEKITETLEYPDMII